MFRLHTIPISGKQITKFRDNFNIEVGSVIFCVNKTSDIDVFVT